MLARTGAWYGGRAGLCLWGHCSARRSWPRLPAVILVLYWWKRGRNHWTRCGAVVPFFATRNRGRIVHRMARKLPRRSRRGPSGISRLLDRLLIAGRAAWFYCFEVGLAAAPYVLLSAAGPSTITPRGNTYFRSTAMCCSWTVADAKADRRGPLAAALIFGGVLVPVLGFLNVYPFRFSFVADHFQYHASVALLALAAAGIVMALRRTSVDAEGS